ncbi:unnamed protein product [Macrosiphum euphorbiae]|uniref:Uncharacterized protein n=1 Tax=Macrosiphum euphorbiae TaxID=13131 RepID=A0AAV0WK76_9HEMI|nr:unnamed protein product [Macrosiphum euphorbiae]
MVFDERKPSGVKEKNEALLSSLRWVLRVHFAEDRKLLTSGRNCSTKLRVSKAFIDIVGDLFKVGGRLRESDLPFENRHPILRTPG